MRKIILLILILLLGVLVGAGCGKEKLDKKLSEIEIKAVLEKTAQDLGWGSVDIAKKEGKNGMKYEFRYMYDSARNKYVNLTVTDLLSLENFQDDYAKNACEKTKNTKIEDVLDTTLRTIDTKVINLSGFDVCYYELYSDYGKQCKTCVSCVDVKSTRAVIGNYWFSIFSHIAEDDKEVLCDPVDPVSVAEVLIKNLLEALKQ